MKDFYVGFWWNTDERCEWNGKAASEIHAIASAMTALDIAEWCTLGKEFHISVKVRS